MKVPLCSLRFPLFVFLHAFWHEEPIIEMTINHFDVIPLNCVNSLSYTVIFGVYPSMNIYETINNITNIIKRLKQRIRTDWVVLSLKTHPSKKQSFTLHIDKDNMAHYNELPSLFSLAHNGLHNSICDKSNTVKSLFNLCAEEISYKDKMFINHYYTMPISIIPKPIKWLIE